MGLVSGSFLCAAYKSIISSPFLFWGFRSTFSEKTPKEFPATTHQNPKMGLRSLIMNPKSGHIIHKNYKLASPPSQSTTTLSSSTRSLLNGGPPSWSTSSHMDDVLGTESGFGVMASSIEDLFLAAGTTRVYNPKPKSERVKREFPPPIPFLAQTGNRPCCLPWNLTRDYSNGRLVLRGEKVENHEYFEAERENGRLVMKLVLLDNTITTCDDVPLDNNEDMNVVEVDEEHDEELEMGDVQFADEEDDTTVVNDDVGDADEYTNNKEDDDDDDIDEGDSNAVEESTPVMAIPCNSVPQSHMEISRCAEKYGDLPKYFINGFNEAGGIHENPRNYFGHPASAPLFVQ